MRTLGDVFVGKENNLSFIRLIAALAVIYGHANAVVPGESDWVARTTGYAFAGGVAVDLFFLISGFLVTASILKGGVWFYLISRALRIYPALWTNMLIVCFVVGPIVSSLPVVDYLTDSSTWSYFFGLSLTYKGAFFLPGVFESNYNAAVNGSIWSVLIEVWLYVVVLIFYLLGILKSKVVFNCVFFVLIIAVWQNPDVMPSFFSGTTNIHVCLMFYIGCFLYLNRDEIPTSPFFFLVALFLAGLFIGTERFSMAYVLLLVTFFCSVSFGKQFAWVDRIGDYSYGVYLFGWPSQQIVASVWPQLNGIYHAGVAMLIALVCGVLSWHFVEKPALGLKARFSRN